MEDFNTRSGTLSDCITNDSPIHLPLPPEYTSDEVWLRVSEDKKVNNYGKELINLCISSRLRIMNGRIGMDKGQRVFTCITPRGSSVVDYSVDYSVASIDLFKLINVGEISPLSDHRLLTTKITTDSHSTFQLQNLRRSAGSLLEEVLDRMAPAEPPLKYQIYWSQDLITELKDSFHFDSFKHKLSSLTSQLDPDNVNENVSRFTDLLQTTIHSCSNAKLKPNTHKARSFPRTPGSMQNANTRKKRLSI